MSMSTRDPMFNDDEIEQLARSVEAHDFERINPPPTVWNNILAELEVEVAGQEATARRQSTNWFSKARLLSAAAAVLVMVGVAVAVVSFQGNESSVNEVASAALTDEGLPVATSEVAQAAFVCDDTNCYVDLDITALPDSDGNDLELWVINGDVTDIRSLGLVTETSGRFRVPAGISVDGFPIVDISLEPDDGDATHSGQSVLRGVLEQG